MTGCFRLALIAPPGETVGFRACRYEPGGPSALITRNAQALYSGIFEIGSWAEIVTWLMLRGRGPVVGDEDRIGADRLHDVGPQGATPMGNAVRDFLSAKSGLYIEWDV